MPRILVRIEKAGWVRRVRGGEDRRMIQVPLPQAGTVVAESKDGAVNDLMAGVFGTLAEADLERPQ